MFNLADRRKDLGEPHLFWNTESYYFKSLCNVLKNLTIKPDYPKYNIFNLPETFTLGLF